MPAGGHAPTSEPPCAREGARPASNRSGTSSAACSEANTVSEALRAIQAIPFCRRVDRVESTASDACRLDIGPNQLPAAMCQQSSERRRKGSQGTLPPIPRASSSTPSSRHQQRDPTSGSGRAHSQPRLLQPTFPGAADSSSASPHPPSAPSCRSSPHLAPPRSREASPRPPSGHCPPRPQIAHSKVKPVGPPRTPPRTPPKLPALPAQAPAAAAPAQATSAEAAPGPRQLPSQSRLSATPPWQRAPSLGKEAQDAASDAPPWIKNMRKRFESTRAAVAPGLEEEREEENAEEDQICGTTSAKQHTSGCSTQSTDAEPNATEGHHRCQQRQQQPPQREASPGPRLHSIEAQSRPSVFLRAAPWQPPAPAGGGAMQRLTGQDNSRALRPGDAHTASAACVDGVERDRATAQETSCVAVGGPSPAQSPPGHRALHPAGEALQADAVAQDVRLQQQVFEPDLTDEELIAWSQDLCLEDMDGSHELDGVLGVLGKPAVP